MRGISIQGQHVRVQALDLLARDQRVGRGTDHLDAGVARQQIGQDLSDQCRVVDHQDAAGGLQCPFEQLHATGDRGLGQAGAHGRFGGGDFGFVRMRQALHHHPAPPAPCAPRARRAPDCRAAPEAQDAALDTQLLASCWP